MEGRAFSFQNPIFWPRGRAFPCLDRGFWPNCTAKEKEGSDGCTPGPPQRSSRWDPEAMPAWEGRARGGKPGWERRAGQGSASCCTEPIFWPPMGHAASRSVQGSDAKAEDPGAGRTADPPGMPGVVPGGGTRHVPVVLGLQELELVLDAVARVGGGELELLRQVRGALEQHTRRCTPNGGPAALPTPPAEPCCHRDRHRPRSPAPPAPVPGGCGRGGGGSRCSPPPPSFPPSLLPPPGAAVPSVGFVETSCQAAARPTARSGPRAPHRSVPSFPPPPLSAPGPAPRPPRAALPRAAAYCLMAAAIRSVLRLLGTTCRPAAASPGRAGPRPSPPPPRSGRCGALSCSPPRLPPSHPPTPQP